MADENDSDQSEGETQYGGRDDEMDAVEQTERRTGGESDEEGESDAESGAEDEDENADEDAESEVDDEEWEQAEHENPDDRD